MATEKENNPNSVYLVYDRDGNRSMNDIQQIIPSFYINNMPDKEGRDKMYICAMPKEYYDNTKQEKLDEQKICIRRFRPPINDKLKEGTTYGLFVASESDYKIFSKSLINLFSRFEKKNFIIKDSYEIIFPKPYPNGDMRKYAIVTFKKNEKGIYPKAYIRKLKVLINNSNFEDTVFKVDWLSVNVMKDIKSGQIKNKKEEEIKPAQSVTA